MKKYNEIVTFDIFYKVFSENEKMPNTKRAFMEKLYQWYQSGYRAGTKDKTMSIMHRLGLED